MQGPNPHLLCLLHWQAGFIVLFCFFTTSATSEALYNGHLIIIYPFFKLTAQS